MDIFSLFKQTPSSIVGADDALPGRSQAPFELTNRHAVLGTPLLGPFPADTEALTLGMGCFWGAEEYLWRLPGVYTTAVGYQGGSTPNPTYEEVCSGMTGHAEVALVVYRPAQISTYDILKVFWENHDPTQGYRQGNDVGTQYRSAIYTHNEQQRDVAESTAKAFAGVLADSDWGEISTEIAPAADQTFYYAEDYHQQYLHKVPNGYRCHSATGLTLPPAT